MRLVVAYSSDSLTAQKGGGGRGYTWEQNESAQTGESGFVIKRGGNLWFPLEVKIGWFK